MQSTSEYQAILHAIIDSSDDAIIARDLSGVVTLWNDAAEKLFGYSRSEMLGQPSDILVPADLRAEEARVFDTALKGARIEHYETVRITKTGARFNVSLTVSPVRASSGELVGLSHVVRDITLQRIVESQARHLATLVDSSEDAIVSKDLDGIVRSWNHAAEGMFEYTAAEIVGHSIRAIIPQDRWAEEDTVLARVRGGERIEHFETIRQRKDGTLIPVSLTVSPIRSSTGEIVGASKIARDLSELSLMERESSRLGAIVNSSDDAIISKDLDGVVQTWNRAAEDMFGFTAEEMIGRSITTIIPEERLMEETAVLDRIRHGRSVDHFETVRRAKNGTLVPISLTVSPIRDRQGVIVGASKIARNISALRAYATTLEQMVKDRTAALEVANTHLEAFAYSVSHDLRAPLRGMQGLAHALLEDYGDELDARGRDYASRIVSEAKLLDQLIQDLLAYSRLAHIDVALETVDIKDALEASMHNLREEIAEKNAKVEVLADDVSIRANRAVLVQVFSNLISNAVKFGGQQPTVHVRVERGGERLRVAVEDHGIGIAPQHHERVFRAFERLHGVESYPGTGMGLAIVRKGVERLGGTVGVESAEGRGSCFWVEFPISEAA